MHNNHSNNGPQLIQNFLLNAETKMTAEPVEFCHTIYTLEEAKKDLKEGTCMEVSTICANYNKKKQ